MTLHSSAAVTPARFDRLDALRGLAMVWMTVFHFCFDLSHQGWLQQDFYTDRFWTWQRSAIVSLFLLCAGAGQAVALTQGQSLARFSRRWAQVAGAALLVSVGSYAMFPRSYIYFGVLHGMAVMLLLLRFSQHPSPNLRALWLIALGVGSSFWWGPALMQSLHWQAGANARPWNLLGWISELPVTEDYVPLVPWLAVMAAGMALAARDGRRASPWLRGPVHRGLQPLATLGRWSLSYYLMHQPVLIGSLMAVAWLRG